MNDIQTAKLQSFMADRVLTDAVYAVLLDAFLAGGITQDVHVLAASRLAVDYLRDGWKELGKYKPVGMTEEIKISNVGL